MRQDKGKTGRSKGVYRVKNGKAYNAGLIARGHVTMWIDAQMLRGSAHEEGEGKRGRPRVYADAVIQMLLTLKQVYRLPLRAVQGFAQSLRERVWPALQVPYYTTLSRRAPVLEVKLPVIRSGEPLHLVVDSTGVKVFGEGEWKGREHGYAKRRTWRKVHLGLDLKTRPVRAALMTHRDVDDASVLPDLLSQIPADEPIAVVVGDGAYDTKAVHAAIAAHGATPLIPPREGAAYWPLSEPGAAWRNRVIELIAHSSPSAWKQHSGYHCRSLVENLMGRLKTLTGEKCWARRLGAQATEVAIRVDILNRMAAWARPCSVRIA
jgi:hypothetical protein